MFMIFSSISHICYLVSDRLSTATGIYFSVQKLVLEPIPEPILSKNIIKTSLLMTIDHVEMNDSDRTAPEGDHKKGLSDCELVFASIGFLYIAKTT